MKAFGYMGPTEEGAISSAGGGVHAVIVLVFGLQLGLKLVLKSTMQYLWDTVH